MKLQLRELVKSIMGCWPCSPTQEGLSTTPKVCLILSSGHYLLITLNYSRQTPKWSSWTLIQLLPFPPFMAPLGCFSHPLDFSTLNFSVCLQEPLAAGAVSFLSDVMSVLVTYQCWIQKLSGIWNLLETEYLCCLVGSVTCATPAGILVRGVTAAELAKAALQKHREVRGTSALKDSFPTKISISDSNSSPSAPLLQSSDWHM